jgi:hypothetical protein
VAFRNSFEIASVPFRKTGSIFIEAVSRCFFYISGDIKYNNLATISGPTESTDLILKNLK